MSLFAAVSMINVCKGDVHLQAAAMTARGVATTACRTLSRGSTAQAAAKAPPPIHRPKVGVVTALVHTVHKTLQCSWRLLSKCRLRHQLAPSNYSACGLCPSDH